MPHKDLFVSFVSPKKLCHETGVFMTKNFFSRRGIQKNISALLLLTFFFQTFSIQLSRPAIAASGAEGVEQTKVELTKRIPRAIHSFNNKVGTSCRNFLLATAPEILKKGVVNVFVKDPETRKGFYKKVNHFAVTTYRRLIDIGWVTSAIPLFQAFGNETKFRHLLIERPTMGLVTTGVGVVATEFITQKEPISLGHLLDVLPRLLRTYVEQFFAFTTSNFPRNSVALNESLKKSQKLFFDYIFSVSYYSVTTGIADLSAAMATGSQERLVLAISKVLFSFVWPVISRPIGQATTIYLFSGFPKVEQLKKTYESGFDLKNWNSSQNTIIQELSAKLDTVPKKIAEAEENLKLVKAAKNDLSLLKKVSIPNFDRTPKRLRLSRAKRELAALKDLKTKLKTDLKSKKSEYFWINWLRKGLTPDQSVPKYKRYLYYNIRQAIDTAVGGSILVLYLILRGWSVGKEYDTSYPLQHVSSELIRLWNQLHEKMEVTVGDLNPSEVSVAELSQVVPQLEPELSNLVENPEFAKALDQEVDSIEQSGGIENNMTIIGIGPTTEEQPAIIDLKR